MMKLLCVMVGIYILIDAIYLASSDDGNEKSYIIAKYTLAMMSAGYFIFSYANEDRLLFGITIAAFMFPETMYRILIWVQSKYPIFYCQYLSRFDIFTRRRNDS